MEKLITNVLQDIENNKYNQSYFLNDKQVSAGRLICEFMAEVIDQTDEESEKLKKRCLKDLEKYLTNLNLI